MVFVPFCSLRTVCLLLQYSTILWMFWCLTSINCNWPLFARFFSHWLHLCTRGTASSSFTRLVKQNERKKCFSFQLEYMQTESTQPTDRSKLAGNVQVTFHDVLLTNWVVFRNFIGNTPLRLRCENNVSGRTLALVIWHWPSKVARHGDSAITIITKFTNARMIEPAPFRECSRSQWQLQQTHRQRKLVIVPWEDDPGANSALEFW